MIFKRYKSKGFTLIELLVVISIISLLSSIVLAALNDARAKARDSRRISDLRQIHTALQLYLQDHEEAPNNEQVDTVHQIHSASEGNWSEFEDLLSNYITSLPVDPLNGIEKRSKYPDTTGGNTYRYSYSRIDEQGPTCTEENPAHPNCSNLRNYLLDASFEKRAKVGDLPISAQFFGMTYEAW